MCERVIQKMDVQGKNSANRDGARWEKNN